MADLFAGGPTVSETLEQARDKPEVVNNNAQQNIYGAFSPDKKEPISDLDSLTMKGVFDTDTRETIYEKTENDLVEAGEDGYFDLPNALKEVEMQDEVLNETMFEKNSENPVTPLLERINNIGGISLSENDISKIYEHVGEIMPEDDVKLKLLEAIKKTEFEDPIASAILEAIIEKIILDNDVKEDSEGNINLPDEFKSNDLLNNKENRIIKLLAKNYLKFPDGNDGAANFEKDLTLSIDITVNKIINGKIFSRNEAFDIAMNEVHNGDLETKLNALDYIYSLVNTAEGLKGVKNKNEISKFDKIKKEHQIRKEKYYDKKIEKLQLELKTLKSGVEDIIEIEKLTKKIEFMTIERNRDDFTDETFHLGKKRKESQSATGAIEGGANDIIAESNEDNILSEKIQDNG